MNALKRLLIVFNLTDPIKDNTVGVFPSTHFQELYDELTESASQSEIDALIVGATIEDLDIKDLKEFIVQTTNSKVIETYTPQHISQEEFDKSKYVRR